MAEHTSGDSPDTSRGGDAAHRRRRTFESTDAANDAGAPSAPERKEPIQGTVPAGIQRRRVPGAAEAGTANATPATPEPAAPSEKAPTPAPKPEPVAPPPPPPPPPAKAKKPEAQGNEVSGARRTIRVVLLLVLMVMLAGVFYILIEEIDQGGGYVQETVPTFNLLPPDPKGDELAETLSARIAAGNYETVIAQRDEYMNIEPRHAGVFRNVYLADAVKAVRGSYDALTRMSTTEADDGSFLAVEERLRRLVPRMAILNRMTEFRTDWDATLLDAPGVRDIFEKTKEETFLANRRVTEWRRYQAIFEGAYTSLATALPGYETIIERLQPLDQILPSNGVMRICRNLRSLATARNSVAANDMHSANTALSEIEISNYARPPQGIEHRFEAEVEAQRDRISSQFASWRRLWEESEKAAALYSEGKMGAAITEIEQVIASATPDSSASQALYDELIARTRRWTSINDAYTEAEKQDVDGSVPDRMRAWQAFAMLLDPERDGWQVTQAIDGAQRLKNEFNARLEDFHDKYAETWNAYEEISSRQRQPSSPRAEFAEAAEGLKTLARAAEETLRIRSLATTIELSEKSRLALSISRQILAEQGGQAQSLWNLGRLYRDRGEIGRFRECLERILLLGDNASNPFYVEAKTLLSEENAGD